MSNLRYCFLLMGVVPCFLLLGIGLRFPEVIQKWSHRPPLVSIQRLSDQLAVGRPLPLKKELMAKDNRSHVFVIRSERQFWSGADPIDCIDAECEEILGNLQRPDVALNVGTNVEFISKAWGLPLIADRWGKRPSETVTVVAKGDGIVTAIYRHADIGDLDKVFGMTH